MERGVSHRITLVQTCGNSVSLRKPRGVSSSSVCGDGGDVNTCNTTLLVYLRKN